MIVIQETTKWGDNTPNHTYIVTDCKSMLLGYIKANTLETVMLPKAVSFDKRHRTFNKIKVK